MRWEIHNEKYEQANIGVLGVGGGGGNAIKHMISSGVKGVKFISANTDSQALSMIKNAKLIKLGKDLTKGLGAGNDPEKGRLATELSKDEIIEEIKDLEMLFIAAGMGGGTGTGGAPVIAKIAKDLNILTVGIVTTPFKVEGDKRISQAKDGITSLMENIDSLIEIDNEKIFEIFQPDTKIDNAFNEINNVLTNAVKGVSNIILKPSKINVDFADVLTVMSQKGMAIMGYGSARGYLTRKVKHGSLHSNCAVQDEGRGQTPCREKGNTLRVRLLPMGHTGCTRNIPHTDSSLRNYPRRGR